MMELFVNQTRLVKHKDEMSANVCYTYKLQNDTQFSVSSIFGRNECNGKAKAWMDVELK